MSTAAAPVTQATLEQKILQASAEAAQVAEIFSPAVAGAIQAGVAVEPVISSFIQLIAAIFRHHASKAAPPVTQ